MSLKLITFSPSSTLMRDLYARMLLTRIVDEYACKLREQGKLGFVARSCGHEAAQVGSAVCIEVGKDFTLPYYRDLGVVLTIGMAPYEVFRTYLQAHIQQEGSEHRKQLNIEGSQAMYHWGYHKHNMVTGPAPVATQILHAAGIAFASKLRKVSVVTVAYCGDGATTEPDFLEGITFAARHQLPVVIICEQDCTYSQSTLLQDLSLPAVLEYHCIDGTDVIAVYSVMQTAIQHAREGHGPVLLEICVHRPLPEHTTSQLDGVSLDGKYNHDPLLRCRQLLEEQGIWDDQWASQLHARLSTEVEQAVQDALRDAS